MRPFSFSTFALVALVFSLLTFSACGGASAAPSAPNNAPVVTFVAIPTTIQAGQASRITWSTKNATSIVIAPPVPGDDGNALALSGAVGVSPASTTTYVITATGPGGAATGSVTITVIATKPIIDLRVEPQSILVGQSATFSWIAQYAKSMTIDNGVGNAALPSGSATVSPAQTTTYTATATGDGGNTTAQITLQVTSASQLGVTLTSAPATIAAGQATTLSWTSQNATSVMIDQGLGTVALYGSTQVKPSDTATYTATARNAQGDIATASTTVNVVGAGSIDKLQHIIFMIQENRSFDHYFGRLGEYRVARGLPAEVDETRADLALTDVGGHTIQRYHQPTGCIEGVSPSWNETHYTIHGGAMDRYLLSPSIPSTTDPHYTRVMGYYDESDIPFYYDLATTFASSDRFFAPVPSGTIPNRMYLFSASSGGRIFPSYDNDPQPPGSWTQKTIFESLDAAGVDWRYYYQDDSIFLSYYAYWTNADAWKRVRPLSELQAILASPTADKDLAPVVFIEHGANVGTDEHPGSLNIQVGARVVRSVVTGLIASTAWPSSVFILSWDESGGLYDHVPPIAVPSPDDIPPIYWSDNDIRGDFTITGLRLPFIIVSPWVKPGYVSHTGREFTSILKLIETRFGLAPLTRRDAWADPMLEFFDFSQPRLLTVPVLAEQPVNLPCEWTLEVAPSEPK